jgi:hypothetical protein
MATTIEKIQQLVQELGPSLPDIDAVVQTEEPSWAVQFSDETIVIIESAEEPARMILSSELGSPSDSLQLPIYESLLCYNLLWRETGGVKIGLAGPKGALILSSELCLEGLTLMDLQAGIINFASITRSWSKYVVGEDMTAPLLPGIEAGNLHLHA